MLQLLRRLLPPEPLPPHLHVHHDEHGNEILCDESICRPPHRPDPFLMTRVR